MKTKIASAQKTIRQNEQTHGAAIDELLLKQRMDEKELIEVVSGKEKELYLISSGHCSEEPDGLGILPPDA